jgi:hypothetical protein
MEPADLNPESLIYETLQSMLIREAAKRLMRQRNRAVSSFRHERSAEELEQNLTNAMLEGKSYIEYANPFSSMDLETVSFLKVRSMPIESAKAFRNE